jgi:hypothetical protein
MVNNTKQAARSKAPIDETDIDPDEEELTEADLSNLPALPAEFGAKALVDNAVGFAPYWRPKKGAVVDLIARSLDIADLSFIRVTCEYIGDVPLECRTGSKGDDDDNDESTPILVKKGELFTVSWYATLPLEYGIKHATPIRVIVLKKSTAGKTEDGEPKKLWNFKYQTSEAGQRQISAEKMRSMGWGQRNVKTNPAYLLAFVGEGVSLAAPPPGMALNSGKPAPSAARAEA